MRKPQPPHSQSGGAGRLPRRGQASWHLWQSGVQNAHWAWSRQPGSHPRICFSLTCDLGGAPPSLCLGFPTCNMALIRPPRPLWSPSPHAVWGLAQSSSPSRGLPTSLSKQDLGRGGVGSTGAAAGSAPEMGPVYQEAPAGPERGQCFISHIILELVTQLNAPSRSRPNHLL